MKETSWQRKAGIPFPAQPTYKGQTRIEKTTMIYKYANEEETGAMEMT